MKQKGTGLVLEGGAMRGLFTAGVLDVWMESGVDLQSVVGVSAGAAFGCNYKSGQIGRAIRYNMRYARDPRYCSVRSLLKTGDLYGADFCYHELPEKLDPFDFAAYDASPMEFICVVTDVETGEAVYHDCPSADYEMMEWLRASGSMPIASRPVELAGRRYLDGGIADPIPLRFMEERGHERNVVVLTQPRGYEKKPGRMPLQGVLLRGMPGVAARMRTRHEDYNATRVYAHERAAQGKVFLLEPPETLPVRRITHDPEKMRQVYEIGRREAQTRLGELRAFLAEG